MLSNSPCLVFKLNDATLWYFENKNNYRKTEKYNLFWDMDNNSKRKSLKYEETL